ncbi:hypothetical protein DealDRAFT_0274 [Dethiobacter alkaliphilus AHT 1]|uniref:Uncharacterized protein n=1 Tax=Dethiobacter alkaliphilus AHT 1 TaxID=555088 RepID=C0GCR5_DETAL|nr:hypothetical protein DealDRAFT_0274 [Dethiobacter alkaliphilus AHT 1]
MVAVVAAAVQVVAARKRGVSQVKAQLLRLFFPLLCRNRQGV